MYDLEYARSMHDPAGFWDEAASKLSWHTQYTEVMPQADAVLGPEAGAS